MILVLIFLLIIKKAHIIDVLSSYVKAKRNYYRELIFYLSYSMDRDYQDLLVVRGLYLLYQLILSWLLIYAALDFLELELGVLYLFSIIGFFTAFIWMANRIEENKRNLIEDISKFVFHYELYLIQGENQLHALKKASQYLLVFSSAQTLEEFDDYFQELFTYTKWLVVKRITILIERGRHFSQADLSMDFAQISDELFRKNYQDKKLQAEKLENMMLIPMVGDLLAMIIYIVSPFISTLIVGG